MGKNQKKPTEQVPPFYVHQYCKLRLGLYLYIYGGPRVVYLCQNLHMFSKFQRNTPNPLLLSHLLWHRSDLSIYTPTNHNWGIEQLIRSGQTAPITIQDNLFSIYGVSHFQFFVCRKDI